MKFHIEQVALCPHDPERAIQLLTALGLTEWARDIVVAQGQVGSDEQPATNVAALAFNYDSSPEPLKPLELEVLHYRAGANWMDKYPARVSHLGMHCSATELYEVRRAMERLGIGVAQEVRTISHTNPVIAGKRWYQYVIFNTYSILGVDLKFIVRQEKAPAIA